MNSQNHRSIQAATALFVAISLFSNTAISQGFSYSPHPGFETQEGARSASQFGALQTGRHQMADGSLRNNAFTVRALAFRPDGFTDYQNQGVGRSWSNVSLRMSECDLDKLTRTFSTNPIGTPTTVFSGPVTWPTLSGVLGWGQSFTHSFPFAKSSWVYSGRNDILCDFEFQGGALANNKTWSANASVSYYLDTWYAGNFGAAPGMYLGKRGASGGCVDGGSGSSWGSYNQTHCRTYGPTYGTVSYRNKHRIWTSVNSAGKNVPVIISLSGLGSTVGSSLPGVKCQKLFIDFRLPTLIAGATTGGFGSLNHYWGLPNGLFPHNAAHEGVAFYSQVAWNDTKTGEMRLTAGFKNWVAALPRFTSFAAVRRKSVYSGGTLPVQGPTSDFQLNPICRYSH